MAINMKGKDLISIHDLTLEEVYQIFQVSKTLKQKQFTGEPHRVLEGKTLGMIFTKPSTRTRISFRQEFIILEELECTSVQTIFSLAEANQFLIPQKFYPDT